MSIIRIALALVVTLGLSGCASKFRTYDGPEVTRVYIHKEDRRMMLMHNDQVLETYRVGLGFAPDGHKQFEGDGRTPVGEYIIDRRNPNSQFHLSIGISYPNEADIAFARAAGQSPGGDIFIHGRGPWHQRDRGDWTWGCVAVSDRQMEDIYAMVRDGTPITILP